MGVQVCADRRVAMDGDRELTWTYLQRVGTALHPQYDLSPEPTAATSLRCIQRFNQFTMSQS